jgi:hypothetical protein
MIKRRKPAETTQPVVVDSVVATDSPPPPVVDPNQTASVTPLPWKWVLVVLLVVGCSTLLWQYLRRHPQATVVASVVEEATDPRETFDTPFRNVKPVIQYVGDKACTSCHSEETHAFHKHSMGRSITPIAEMAPKQQYDGSKNNPFVAHGKEYRIDKTNDRVTHKEIIKDAQGNPVVETEADVLFAIGSGSHACSYLIVKGDRVIQSPITWYPQKQRWDLSPGFEAAESAENTYSRPIGAECLFCHSNQVKPVEGSMNRYKMPLFPLGSAIGCERCHGPGELHVKERAAGLTVPNHVDYSIVNPKHLEPELREAVCQQCHLEGNQRILRRGRQAFDFRPGLPLHEFYSTFLNATEAGEHSSFTGHVEQMYSSKCFIVSQGKMGCATCHNPHDTKPGAPVDLHRQRCISCHQDKGCSEPMPARQKLKDNCITCHMPRKASSNIQHTAITDHRILRKQNVPAPNQVAPQQSTTPLVAFQAGKLKLNEAEAARDLGIALTEMMKQPGVGNRQMLELAMPMLDASVKRWPSDLAALEAKAFLHFVKGEARTALDIIDRVLTLSPQRESALAAAVNFAMQAGEMEKAFTYSKTAVALNPYLISWRYRIAQLHLQRKEYEQAITHCREAIAQVPGTLRVRMLLVQALVQGGQPSKAQEEFDVIMKMNPPNKDELQKMFNRLKR